MSKRVIENQNQPKILTVNPGTVWTLTPDGRLVQDRVHIIYYINIFIILQNLYKNAAY